MSRPPASSHSGGLSPAAHTAVVEPSASAHRPASQDASTLARAGSVPQDSLAVTPPPSRALLRSPSNASVVAPALPADSTLPSAWGLPLTPVAAASLPWQYPARQWADAVCSSQRTSQPWHSPDVFVQTPPARCSQHLRSRRPGCSFDPANPRLKRSPGPLPAARQTLRLLRDTCY